jgi:hypothetical protein
MCFLRDKFSCQYCGSNEELTFDHLLPRSKGGETNWDNVVTACSACNVKKGGKLLKHSDMKLINTLIDHQQRIYIKMVKIFHQIFYIKAGWIILYWDVELELKFSQKYLLQF